MPSERQREANRRNGRRGGPKTEAGKERSRLNSRKHGLTSSTLVVLPEENPHEYEEVLRGFRESFQPHDSIEDALVLRLAQAHWRSLRSRRLETGMLDTTAATLRGRAQQLVEDCPKHLNLHNAIGVGFMTMPPERWQMYLRYDTTISRDFFRTLDALTKLQNARQRKAPQAKARAAGSAAELSDSGIRSVSQTSTAHESKPQKNNKHHRPKRQRRRPNGDRMRISALHAARRIYSRIGPCPRRKGLPGLRGGMSASPPVSYFSPSGS